MQVVLTLLLPRDVTTVAVARQTTGRILADAGLAPDDVADLTVALTEACSNAVRYAVARRTYRVEVRLGRDRCELAVSDGGPGFDVDALEMPPPEAERGRGLPLMEALVDDVRIEAGQAGRTTVTLRKALSPMSPRGRVVEVRRQGRGRATPPNEEAHDG